MGHLSTIAHALRPRFRFRLRTIFLVTTLVAASTVLILNHQARLREQRVIVAQVEALGGLVYYEHQKTEWGFTDRRIPPPGWKPFLDYVGDDFFLELRGISIDAERNLQATSFEWERLTELRQISLIGNIFPEERIKHAIALKKLESLGLLNVRLRPRILSELAACENLNRISLWGKTFGDDHVQRLADFPRLRRVCLYDTAITPVGIRALGYCERLDALRITWPGEEGMRFSSDDWAPLANLTGLEFLGLSNNVDNALGAVGSMTKLRRLHLWKCDATDDGLANVSGLLELERFEVQSRTITDDGVKHLAGLKKLRHLEFSSSHITDASLDTFLGLESLETLDLRFANLTDAGILRLAKLPSLKRLIVTYHKTLTAQGAKQFEISGSKL
ncbi:MAG: hypothetical protein QM811_08245 [Pirellulales bacterium]